MPIENVICPECGHDVVKPIPKKVGRDLRKRREKKKLSVRWIAAHLHCVPEYVYMLETGQRKLSHDLLHRYNEVLERA